MGCVRVCWRWSWRSLAGLEGEAGGGCVLSRVAALDRVYGRRAGDRARVRRRSGAQGGVHVDRRRTPARDRAPTCGATSIRRLRDPSGCGRSSRDGRRPRVRAGESAQPLRGGRAVGGAVAAAGAGRARGCGSCSSAGTGRGCPRAWRASGSRSRRGSCTPRATRPRSRPPGAWRWWSRWPSGARARASIPRFGALLCDHAGELLERVSGVDAWERVVAVEPRPRVFIGDDLAQACQVIADYADLKSYGTLGHSRAVAEVAEAAGWRLGFDAGGGRGASLRGVASRPRPGRRVERRLGEARSVDERRVGAGAAAQLPQRAVAGADPGACASSRARPRRITSGSTGPAITAA